MSSPFVYSVTFPLITTTEAKKAVHFWPDKITNKVTLMIGLEENNLYVTILRLIFEFWSQLLPVFTTAASLSLSILLFLSLFSS